MWVGGICRSSLGLTHECLWWDHANWQHNIGYLYPISLSFSAMVGVFRGRPLGCEAWMIRCWSPVWICGIFNIWRHKGKQLYVCLVQSIVLGRMEYEATSVPWRWVEWEGTFRWEKALIFPGLCSGARGQGQPRKKCKSGMRIVEGGTIVWKKRDSF